MSTRNGAAIVLSGAVMETVAEVLRVGESPLFLRCDVKIKRSSIIGRSCPEYHFCQKYACRDNRFVEKKICLSRQIFAATNIFFVARSILLSRQTRVCSDKYLS